MKVNQNLQKIANRNKQQDFEQRMKDENRKKITFYPNINDIEKAVEKYRKKTGTKKTNITREAIKELFESNLKTTKAQIQLEKLRGKIEEKRKEIQDKNPNSPKWEKLINFLNELNELEE